jgi:aerobic-type carbon monoxide dehydrogenase small subunit (CoxS/CutS family)
LSGELLIELTINGRSRSARTQAAATLLTVLRDELMLTGAKRGCNQGICGACTVLIDGTPMRSCLSLAINVVGRQITTIEALAQKPELASLQNALLECGAIQCGFCMSGMLVSASFLLQQNVKPTMDEARTALSGNLCRCSGYTKILEAVCSANKDVQQ